MPFFGLIASRRHERAGFALYTSSVAAARDPLYFERLSVPDTLDGRFDLVGLFAALLIRRLTALPKPGPALAQAVFDAMFADMDFSLREIGVGEMSVGRKVRAMWEAFHGRAMAYEQPLAAQDAGALEAALARNVWRGAAPAGSAAGLARAALAQDAAWPAKAWRRSQEAMRGSSRRPMPWLAPRLEPAASGRRGGDAAATCHCPDRPGRQHHGAGDPSGVPGAGPPHGCSRNTRAHLPFRSAARPGRQHRRRGAAAGAAAAELRRLAGGFRQ